MISMCSAFLLATAVCRDSTAPTGSAWDALRALANSATVNPDSIRLTYVCGNKFRIRNSNDAVAEVKWDVYKTADSGRIMLPARVQGAPYSETFFTTSVKGTTRLFYGTQLIQTKANGGTTCPLPTVPDVPPDSVAAILWDSLMSPANEVAKPSGLVLVRDVLYVLFAAGASQANKTTAISAVGGQVVGGWVLGGIPEYVIRIPYTLLGPADSAWGPVERAISQLRAQPFVETATPVMKNIAPDTTYRFAADGSGFGSGDWAADRRDNGGSNYFLELDNAPMMWGCATGAGLTFSLVDIGFPNLDPTELRFATGAELSPLGGPSHGSAMAGIAAAIANNHKGTTGLLWNAQVRSYRADSVTNPATLGTTYGTYDAIARATAAGARVINISLGNSPSTPTDSAAVFAVASVFERRLRPLSTLPHPPLILLSAGNANIDVDRGLLTSVRKYFPWTASMIAIVGGVQKSPAGLGYFDAGGLKSGHGANVDVSAPARDIRLFAGGVANGVSAAVPQVSAVANLLFQQDPSRTPAEVIDILKHSAEEGRFSVPDPNHAGGHVPVLDAYRALKLGAERSPNSALCGNRIWMDDSVLTVSRLSGPQVVDRIRSTPTPVAPYDLNNINPIHGGLYLETAFSWGYALDTTGSAGIWSRQTLGFTVPYDSSGGTFLSFNANDHEVDHAASLYWDTLVVAKAWARRHSAATGAVVSQASHQFPVTGDSIRVCTRENYDSTNLSWSCTDSTWIGSWSGPDNRRRQSNFFDTGPSLAPSDARVFGIVPVTFVTRTTTAGPFGMCPGNPDTTVTRCTPISWRDSTTRGELWRSSLDGGSWALLKTFDASAGTGSWLQWSGVSEDGLTVVLGVASGLRVRSGFSTATSCRDRQVVWMAIDTLAAPGAQVGDIVFTVAMRNPVADCAFDSGHGSIAPNRKPVPVVPFRPPTDAPERRPAHDPIAPAREETLP